MEKTKKKREYEDREKEQATKTKLDRSKVLVSRQTGNQKRDREKEAHLTYAEAQMHAYA